MRDKSSLYVSYFFQILRAFLLLLIWISNNSIDDKKSLSFFVILITSIFVNAYWGIYMTSS